MIFAIRNLTMALAFSSMEILRDTTGDKQVDAQRRRGLADGQVHGHDDAEVNGIDAKLADNRQEDGESG